MDMPKFLRDWLEGLNWARRADLLKYLDECDLAPDNMISILMQAYRKQPLYDRA